MFVLIALFVGIAFSSPQQYILFTRPPGLKWSQDNPSSITSDFLNEVALAFNGSKSKTGKIWIGNEMIFSVLASPESVLIESLWALLNATAELQTVPVSLVFDGQNWWQERFDLWNFWDPSQPGYDKNNYLNVEWENDLTPVRIGWRDWGSQIRVAPEQNILSPKVLHETTSVIKALGTVVKQWIENDPSRRDLIATIKVGWEAGVQYNAYFYPNGNEYINKSPNDDPHYGLNFTKGLSGGIPQLGFSAASVYLNTSRPPKTLSRELIANITRSYVNVLTSTLLSVGVEPEKLSNHVGGQIPPYNLTVPFSAGFTSNGVPGYSFYWGSPKDNDNFLEEMKNNNRSRWAAAEWFLSPSNGSIEGWIQSFLDTLSTLECQHMSVYNWDGDFEKIENGIVAVKEIMKRN